MESYWVIPSLGTCLTSTSRTSSVLVRNICLLQVLWEDREDCITHVTAKLNPKYRAVIAWPPLSNRWWRRWWSVCLQCGRPRFDPWVTESWLIPCAQLCLTLLWPHRLGLPGSSVHEIVQARILEWVAISFSRGYFWPRDWWNQSLLLGRWILYHCPPGKPKQTLQRTSWQLHIKSKL